MEGGRGGPAGLGRSKFEGRVQCGGSRVWFGVDLDEAVAHGLLGSAQRHAGVVELLVRLAGSLGVADLALRGGGGVRGLQGLLAHTKQPFSRTVQ